MSALPPLAATPEGDAPDMAAAELALGLLEGEERAEALRRVLSEPGFAGAVERWRGHVAHLFDLWPEIAAPEILRRIEHSIDRHGNASVATRVTPPRAQSRWWPGVAALSSIAAAGLLAVLVTRPLPVPPPPPPAPHQITPASPTLVASIDLVEAGTPVTALYDARAGALRLTEATLSQARQSAELWVIPADGTPHSLGLLRARGTTALTLSRANRARIAAGATLAVTLEPVGGSPTGSPTGPIVAKGALAIV